MSASAPTSIRDLAQAFRWGHRPAVPLSAEPFRPEQEGREFPTAWARAPLARAVRAGLQGGALAPVVQAEVRTQVSGLENLDAIGDRGCVLVANHASHLDTAALLTVLPAAWRRRTAVAAAADYFFDAWWRGVGTALLFGTVPVDRRGGGARTASRTPSELLSEGWLVVIYAEGTRSADGTLGRFRQGAAMLALDAGVPLLPVALRGTFAAMPRGRGWPLPGRPRVHVRFGALIEPRPEDDMRALTIRTRAEIVRLIDEDATDWWSSLRRPPAPEGDVLEPVLAADAPPGSWRRSWESTRPVAAPRRHLPEVWD